MSVMTSSRLRDLPGVLPIPVPGLCDVAVQAHFGTVSAREFSCPGARIRFSVGWYIRVPTQEILHPKRNSIRASGYLCMRFPSITSAFLKAASH